MMGDLGFLLRGPILGCSIAAPVGPIGVLCIRRTLAEGRRAAVWVNRGSGAMIVAFGVLALAGLAGQES